MFQPYFSFTSSGALPNTPDFMAKRTPGTTLSIVQLADELAITPVHLNRICQTVAGKSASQLVQEHTQSFGKGNRLISRLA